MSRMFVGLGVLLAVAAGFVTTRGAAPHSYTITLSKDGSDYTARKDDVWEIDYGHTTTFTVVNSTGDSLDYQFDAGPAGSKCRVTFTPPGKKACESPVMTIPGGINQTVTATADNMPWYDYSFLGFWPKFPSDFLLAATGQNPKRVDPELELERDYGTILVGLVALLSVLSFLASWFTRRRV